MSKVEFEIFVTGPQHRYTNSIEVFRKICISTLGETGFEIRVIDVTRDPEYTELKKILAVPTIIRLKPSPEKRVLGDTRSEEKARLAFQVLMDGSTKY